MKAWYDYSPRPWAWFLLLAWLGIAVTVDAQVRHRAEPVAAVAQTPEPPLAGDQDGLIERVVERRIARMLDAADPDKPQGPVTDFLAAQLVTLVGKLIKYMLIGLLTSALIALAWKNWYWIAAWVAGHVGLSWFAGHHGGKKATES